MAKNKQQKKKERERRVAKKKLAATAKRRAQEKTTDESKSIVTDRSKLMQDAVQKPQNLPTSKKSPFTQRRSGG